MLFHTQINEFIVRLEGLGTLAAEAIGVLLGGYIALKWWSGGASTRCCASRAIGGRRTARSDGGR